MQLTYTSAKDMKSAHDYLVCLTMGLLSLKTLESFQMRVFELGILKEDQECTANTLIWDLRRLMKLYMTQASSIAELLPDDMNIEATLVALKAQELSQARKMIRKGKTK